MKSSYLIVPLICVLTAAISLFMPGCGKDNPSDPPEETTFESVIATGGVCPVPIASVVTEDLGSAGEPRDDGTYWDCVTTTYDVTKVPDECQTFDPSTDIIYPAASSRG